MKSLSENAPREYSKGLANCSNLLHQTTIDIPLDSIEKFDTFSRKWQLVAPMKTSRGRHAVC